MDSIERDEVLKRLKHLIEKKKTGNSKELAKEISVSRATLFRLLDHLKIREEKEIKYSKSENCYYFEKTE
jgi:DNA-binding MurR/RpiR family transcriptional regulator